LRDDTEFIISLRDKSSLRKAGYQSGGAAAFSERRLRGFLAVARHLNFRRAAAEIGVTQPALSAQIRVLEKGVGLALFNRTTRHVELTTEGARFVGRARRLLEELDSAVGELHQDVGLERGTVAFSCIPTIAATAFPKIIKAFKINHPGVRVQMTDDTTTAMERRILNGDVDFGVGGEPGWRGDELEFSLITEDPFVLVCRKDHPLALRRRVPIREVVAYPIISLSTGSNVRTTITRCMEADGLTFVPDYELIHHYPVGAMVEAGLGVTLLPSMACGMLLKSRVLRFIELDDRRYSRAVGLIKRRGVMLSPAAERFYALVVKTMAPPDKGRRA
jgi:LysR family carnitine catabolism transcriptional activator